MIMTLVKGPVIEIIKTKGIGHVVSSATGPDLYHTIMGSLMITAGCFCWACFFILQVRSKFQKFPFETVLYIF